MKQPGKRSDLDRMRSTLASSGLRGVVAAGANYQVIKYAEKVVTYNETKRCWKPLVLYIQGEPGWGKSTLASDLAEYLIPGSDNKYTKSSNSKWFDGYDAHPVCILDDWRDSWWPLTESLGLIDRNECRVECKGGSRQFLARVIIMTSVKDFPTVYEKVKADGEPAYQFRRRFDRVITLTNEYRASTKKLDAGRELRVIIRPQPRVQLRRPPMRGSWLLQIRLYVHGFARVLMILRYAYNRNAQIV